MQKKSKSPSRRPRTKTVKSVRARTVSAIIEPKEAPITKMPAQPKNGGSFVVRKKWLLTGFIIALAVLVLGGVGGGAYYWWIGTPQYSMTQLQKAIKQKNPELAFEYIDIDAISESVWTQLEGSLKEELTGDNLFGSILLTLVDAMKPMVKDQMETAMRNAILNPESKEGTAIVITDIAGKKLNIERTDGTAYIQADQGLRLVLTQMPDRRWKIVDVEGLADFIDRAKLYTANNGTAASETAEEVPSAPLKVYNIGQQMELDAVKLKINSAKRAGTYNIMPMFPEYDEKPPEGAEFIIVNVTMENITKNDITWFLPDEHWKLQDSTKREFSTSDESIFGFGSKFAPNIPSTGDIVYEVPIGASGLSLVGNNSKNGERFFYSLGDVK